MTGYILSVDDQNRWSVFAVKDALGSFQTWDEAAKFRDSLAPQKDQSDDAPAWTPKSGGY